MKRLRPAPLLLTGILLLPAVAAAQTIPLGRLFLTPEARVLLERQRQLNIRQTPGMAGEVLRLDGVVVRSSGRSTVWINQQPQTENTRDSGVTVATYLRRPERATVSAGAEAAVDLKVGVTLDTASGEKSGGLADGEIRVRPPVRQK